MIYKLTLKTKSKTDFIDITSKIQNIVDEDSIQEGTCIIFVPHTTAAVTINENADPDVVIDLKSTLKKIVPSTDIDYRHLEGNSAAHLKASLFGFSETLIVNHKSIVLGRWQGIYFCEFDGPREREVFVRLS